MLRKNRMKGFSIFCGIVVVIALLSGKVYAEESLASHYRETSGEQAESLIRKKLDFFSNVSGLGRWLHEIYNRKQPSRERGGRRRRRSNKRDIDDHIGPEIPSEAGRHTIRGSKNISTRVRGGKQGKGSKTVGTQTTRGGKRNGNIGGGKATGSGSKGGKREGGGFVDDYGNDDNFYIDDIYFRNNNGDGSNGNGSFDDVYFRNNNGNGSNGNNGNSFFDDVYFGGDDDDMGSRPKRPTNLPRSLPPQTNMPTNEATLDATVEMTIDMTEEITLEPTEGITVEATEGLTLEPTDSGSADATGRATKVEYEEGTLPPRETRPPKEDKLYYNIYSEEPTNPPTYSNPTQESAQRTMVANMGRYPDSMFPIDTTGQISVRFDESKPRRQQVGKEKVLVEMRDIIGLQPSCDGCSMKLHSGNSCESKNSIGKPIFRNDWGKYDTTEDGIGRGTSVNEMNYQKHAGTVVVLYTRDGQPISCGVFRYAGSPTEASTLIAEMSKYEKYQGNQKPVGQVRANFQKKTKDTSFIFGVDVSGVDEFCTVCKIRIMSGTSCHEDLGKPYESNEGTWDSVTYAGNGDPIKSGSTIKGQTKSDIVVDSGYGFFDNYGRVVVIENIVGVVMACGVLKYQEGPETDRYLIAEISSHPGNTGPEFATGYVHTVHQNNGKLDIQVDLTNIEKSCSSENCTVAIHSGRSCESFDTIGERYFEGDEDVWREANYEGLHYQTLSTLSVTRGAHSFMNSVGKALVVTNSRGDPMGCGVLRTGTRRPSADTLQAKMGTFPGFTGYHRPQGLIRVMFNEERESLSLSLLMTGLDHDCAKCVVQVKSGKTCEDPFLVGKAYYNKEDGASNPWKGAFYTTKGGVTTSRFAINDGGYKFTDYLGHAIVVHGADGTPLSCGLLGAELLRKEGDNLNAKMEKFILAPDPSANPEGNVRMRFLDNGDILLSYDVKGLEPNCQGCRISIRTSQDCNNQGVDFPFLDQTASPLYTDERGRGVGDVLYRKEKVYGADYVATAGLVVSLLNKDDRPMACGQLEFGRHVDGAKKYFASMTKFFTYTAGEPRGVTVIFQKDDRVLMYQDMEKLPNCAVDVCTQHVHTNDNCQDPGMLAINRVPRYKTDPFGTEKQRKYYAKGLNPNDNYNNGALVMKAPFTLFYVSCGVFELVDQTENPREFRSRLMGSDVMPESDDGETQQE